MTTATPTKLSPYGDYVVRAPDRRYKGISAKQEFLNGRAEVRGLPQLPDDCPNDPLLKNVTKHLDTCAVGERIKHLDWFVNAGYRVDPGEFMKAKEEDED